MSKSAAPRALVVGTGFGCRIHVPALRAAGFEVVGLVGSDAQRTRQRADSVAVPQAFTDLNQAIEVSQAVAVTIASPPHTHAELTLTALAHGCHVICEKPMANSLDEARAMLQAAEQAGVTHLIGNQFRWSPERATVARALAAGRLGEPRFLSMINYMPLLADPNKSMPPWWFDAASGGGWLGAHGSHIIDQVRSWLGDFASVSAALPIVSAREGVAEDSYVLRFRMRNGVEGVIQQTAGAWGPIADMTRIAGTEGSLWIDQGVVHYAHSGGSEELPVSDDLLLPADTNSANTHMNPGPYIRLCEVLRAGVEGRPYSSAVAPPTFQDGLACMEVLEAIRKSAAEGGALVNI